MFVLSLCRSRLVSVAAASDATKSVWSLFSNARCSPAVTIRLSSTLPRVCNSRLQSSPGNLPGLDVQFETSPDPEPHKITRRTLDKHMHIGIRQALMHIVKVSPDIEQQANISQPDLGVQSTAFAGPSSKQTKRQHDSPCLEPTRKRNKTISRPYAPRVDSRS